MDRTRVATLLSQVGKSGKEYDQEGQTELSRRIVSIFLLFDSESERGQENRPRGRFWKENH